MIKAKDQPQLVSRLLMLLLRCRAGQKDLVLSLRQAALLRHQPGQVHVLFIDHADLPGRVGHTDQCTRSR